MPKIFKNFYTYEHKWNDVTLAHWLKYPNPFAAHVVASDVIERSFCPKNNMLKSIRLFLKTGSIPKWGQSILSSSKAFIVEESLVDPVNRVMLTRTRNLSHMGIMSVVETQRYTPHPENDEWTLVEAEARIVSGIGWGLAAKIENFGLKRFTDNSSKSRKGMLHVLSEKVQQAKYQYNK